MSFFATDPQSHQSENTWFTPRHLIDALGPFDLDPCTVSFRPFDTAKKHIERDLGGCGLAESWEGLDVWLNPPYGKEIMPFIRKFIFYKKGVTLIFARMGSVQVQDLLNAGAYGFCLRKMVKFIRKDGTPSGDNAGADSIIFFFDEKYLERVSKLEGVVIRNFRNGINPTAGNYNLIPN